MKQLDLYLVGVGGQGILTIADLILTAAMQKGVHCNYFPTKGMAQRGGFVKAQLRLGATGGGPDISMRGADVVISMEQSESLKAIDYLKPEGDMLVYGYHWMPTEVMLGKAPYPDAEAVREQVEKRTSHYTYVDAALLPAGCADNVFVLGAAYAHTALHDLFTAEELLDAVLKRFPKGAESNKLSFEKGQSV